jgi:hypothetical protein
MLEIVIGMVGVIAMLAMKAKATPVFARQFLYEWLGICFCLLMVGATIIYYQSFYGTVVSTTSPTANTIYLNNNYTSITIYATTNSVVRAWVGNTTSTLLMVINNTPTSVTGVSITDLPGSVTSTLVVPQGDYYKFNYTSAAFTLVKVRT